MNDVCDRGWDREVRAASPIHLVLRHLPQLPTTRDGTIDFAAADASVLRNLAEAADTIARSLHLGTSAIGQLMAHSSPELEDGTISSDSVEALGWLLSTLGELGAQMAMLAVHCGRAGGEAGWFGAVGARAPSWIAGQARNDKVGGSS